MTIRVNVCTEVPQISERMYSGYDVTSHYRVIKFFCPYSAKAYSVRYFLMPHGYGFLPHQFRPNPVMYTEEKPAKPAATPFLILYARRILRT